ncbi:MAG: hypothetical protein ACXAE3_09350 [Candidatus Kariarchaeaceae archaeon]|jgi:hypothetical protein
MAKIRGSIFLGASLLLIAYEIYFLVIEPILNQDTDLSLTSNQYWAIVVPILILISLLAGAVGWIGYTMIVTPVPIRLDYEEAYEAAAAGEDIGTDEQTETQE